MVNDLVSDMLTRIRNASLAKHTYTLVSYSKLNVAILKVLLSENYIENYEEKFNKKGFKEIQVFLKYKGWWVKKPYFSIFARVSKPGKRVYSGYRYYEKIIDTLRYQQGIAIISTSSGVMSHSKSIQLKKGGEILCYIG